jgi:hypothetical protein
MRFAKAPVPEISVYSSHVNPHVPYQYVVCFSVSSSSFSLIIVLISSCTTHPLKSAFPGVGHKPSIRRKSRFLSPERPVN